LHEIIYRVQSFLSRANVGEGSMSEEIIEEAAEAFKVALRKQFNEKRSDKFTLRASNVGKATCQLQMEASGAKATAKTPWFKMQMLIGDIVEVAGIAILKAAGVEVTALSEKVSFNVGGTVLLGNTDLTLRVAGEEGIWDFKSASPWSFDNKFKDFASLSASDPFGYVGQGYAYEAGRKLPFKGWIAVQKSTGEWRVVETPDGAEKTVAQNAAHRTIRDNVKAITTNAPFVRCFSDIEETFRKKPTGNRVLGKICEMCDFRDTCWSGLRHEPAKASEAVYKTWSYYTYVDPKWDQKEDAA